MAGPIARVIALSLAHVLHLITGEWFFLLASVTVAVRVAVLGTYVDLLHFVRGGRWGAPNRLTTTIALATLLLGPELLEDLVLGGPIPNTDST